MLGPGPGVTHYGDDGSTYGLPPLDHLFTRDDARRLPVPLPPAGSTGASDRSAADAPPGVNPLLHAFMGRQVDMDLGQGDHCRHPLHTEHIDAFWHFNDNSELDERHVERLLRFGTSGSPDQRDSARNHCARFNAARMARSTRAIGVDPRDYGPYIPTCVACSSEYTCDRNWEGHDIMVLRQYENQYETIAAWSDQCPPTDTDSEQGQLYASIAPAGWFDNEFGVHNQQLNADGWRRHRSVSSTVMYGVENAHHIPVDRPPTRYTKHTRRNMPMVDTDPNAAADMTARINRGRSERINYLPQLHTPIGLKVVEVEPGKLKLRIFVCETAAGTNGVCPPGKLPKGMRMYHSIDDGIGLIRDVNTRLIAWDQPKAFHAIGLSFRHRDYAGYHTPITSETRRTPSLDFGFTWGPLVQVLGSSDPVGTILQLEHGIVTMRIMDNFLTSVQTDTKGAEVIAAATALNISLGTGIHEIVGPAQRGVAFGGTEIRPDLGTYGLLPTKITRYLSRIQAFIDTFIDGHDARLRRADGKPLIPPLRAVAKVMGTLGWLAVHCPTGTTHIAPVWATCYAWGAECRNNGITPMRVNPLITLVKGRRVMPIAAEHDDSLGAEDWERPVDIVTSFTYPGEVESDAVQTLRSWLSPDRRQRLAEGQQFCVGSTPDGPQRDSRCTTPADWLTASGRFHKGPNDSPADIKANNYLCSTGMVSVWSDAGGWGQCAHTTDDELRIVQHRTTVARNINVDEYNASVATTLACYTDVIGAGPTTLSGFTHSLHLVDSRVSADCHRLGYSRDPELRRVIRNCAEQLYKRRHLVVLRWFSRDHNTLADKGSKGKLQRGHSNLYFPNDDTLALLHDALNITAFTGGSSDLGTTTATFRTLNARTSYGTCDLSDIAIVITATPRTADTWISRLLTLQRQHQDRNCTFTACILVPKLGHATSWTTALADSFTHVGTIPSGSTAFITPQTKLWEDDLTPPPIPAGPTPHPYGVYTLVWQITVPRRDPPHDVTMDGDVEPEPGPPTRPPTRPKTQQQQPHQHTPLYFTQPRATPLYFTQPRATPLYFTQPRATPLYFTRPRTQPNATGSAAPTPSQRSPRYFSSPPSATQAPPPTPGSTHPLYFTSSPLTAPPRTAPPSTPTTTPLPPPPHFKPHRDGKPHQPMPTTSRRQQLEQHVARTLSRDLRHRTTIRREELRCTKVIQYASDFEVNLHPHITDFWMAAWIINATEKQTRNAKTISDYEHSASNYNLSKDSTRRRLRTQPLTARALNYANHFAPPTEGTHACRPLTLTEFNTIVGTLHPAIGHVSRLNHARLLYILCTTLGLTRPGETRKLQRWANPTTHTSGVYVLRDDIYGITPIISVFGSKGQHPERRSDRPIPTLNGFKFNAAGLFFESFLALGNGTRPNGGPLCPSATNPAIPLTPLEEHQLSEWIRSTLNHPEDHTIGIYSLRKTLPTLYLNHCRIPENAICDLGHWDIRTRPGNTARHMPSTYAPVDNVNRLATHADAYGYAQQHFPAAP
jgi:hypothetical protein